MHLNTTPTSRMVAIAALILDSDLIQDRSALDRRLGFAEREATEGLSTNTWLKSAFDQMAMDKGKKVLELPSKTAAERLRYALINWTASAVKKDKGVHNLTLFTDIDKKTAAAQELVDQLSEQLSLEIENVQALAVRAEGKEKPAGGKKKKGKKGGKDEDTEEMFEGGGDDDIVIDDDDEESDPD